MFILYFLLILLIFNFVFLFWCSVLSAFVSISVSIFVFLVSVLILVLFLFLFQFHFQCMYQFHTFSHILNNFQVEPQTQSINQPCIKSQPSTCAPTTKKLISVFYLCSIAALGLVVSRCSDGKQKVHTIFSQAAIQIRNAPWQMWKIALKLCGATLKRCIVPFLEVWVEGKSRRSFPACFVWICMNVASCRDNISKGRI